MSKTLKDRPLSKKEQDDVQKKGKGRPARSTFKSKIQHLDPEDWEDLDLETFEKM